jgi:hypothetical protein
MDRTYLSYTLIITYWTMQCKYSQDHNLNLCLHKNLKSFKIKNLLLLLLIRFQKINAVY